MKGGLALPVFFPSGVLPLKPWSAYRIDADGNGNYNSDGDLDQTRTHNNVNEITGISESYGTAWADPAHDARGNMTTVPKPNEPANAFTCKYDAWNRLTEVREGGIVIAEYRYDAMNRRTVKLVPHTVEEATNWHRTDVYYNLGWQGLEERFADDVADASRGNLATAVKVQWVWSLRYIDAPVCRDRDADGQSGTGLEERLFYTTDANMNVTALINASGSVVERYLYDPYGRVKVLDPDWSSDADNQSDYASEILYCGYRYNPETGLYDVRYRPLQPALGMWIRRDPSGYAKGVNLYLYCRNSPQTLADPFGLRVPDEDRYDFTGPVPRPVLNPFGKPQIETPSVPCCQRGDRRNEVRFPTSCICDCWPLTLYTPCLCHEIGFSTYDECDATGRWIPRGPKLYLEWYLGQMVFAVPWHPLTLGATGVGCEDYFRSITRWAGRDPYV